MIDARVRKIIEGTPQEASSALGWLMNGAFHQGQHDADTQRVVPVLMSLLRSTSKVRAEVMAALGSLVPAPQFDDLTVESSFWMSDENEDSAASVAAVKLHRAELEGFLNDDDVELRCATVWTLSLLKPESEPVLRARLAVEKDERVYCSLVLALGGGPGDSDVERVLRATAPIDEITAAAFARLLVAPHAPWLRFEGGLLSSVAGRALGRIARAEPRAASLLTTALDALEARVSAGPPPRDRSQWIRVNEDQETYDAGRAAWPAFEASNRVGGLLTWVTLGARVSGPPLRLSELDVTRRALLPRLSVGNSEPRKTTAGLARFLNGGDVLDESLTVNGVSAPICEHVWAACAEGPWNVFDEPKLLAVCDAALRTLPSERCFELATSLLERELPYLKLPAMAVVGACFSSVATAERVLAYAARQTTRFTQYEEDLAKFLLAQWYPQRAAPPVEFDLVVSGLLFSPKYELAWLAAFPPLRRAALIAQFRADDFPYCAPLCTREEISDAVLAAFLAPDCRWRDFDAQPRLHYVDVERLRTANITGSRRRVVEKVLREQGEVAQFTLTMKVMPTGLQLWLERGASALVSSVTVESLAPLASALMVCPRRRIKLSGTVPPELEYQLQLALGELAHPVEVIDTRGTVLTTR